MLKEYLKANYIWQKYNVYKYRFLDMCNEEYWVHVDRRKHIIGDFLKEFKYNSEQQAISFLHGFEAEIMNLQSQNIDADSLQNKEHTDNWNIKYNDIGLRFESKILSRVGEVISLAFYMRDDGTLGAYSEFYNDGHRYTRDLPISFPKRSYYYKEFKAFMLWHIKQNNKSLRDEDYFDFKLNLQIYDMTLTEFKEKYLMQQNNNTEILFLKQNNLEVPLLYYANRCCIWDVFNLNTLKITDIIDDIINGKTKVDNIHFFDGCPYFKSET